MDAYLSAFIGLSIPPDTDCHIWKYVFTRIPQMAGHFFRLGVLHFCIDGACHLSKGPYPNHVEHLS